MYAKKQSQISVNMTNLWPLKTGLKSSIILSDYKGSHCQENNKSKQNIVKNGSLALTKTHRHASCSFHEGFSFDAGK